MLCFPEPARVEKERGERNGRGRTVRRGSAHFNPRRGGERRVVGERGPARLAVPAGREGGSRGGRLERWGMKLTRRPHASEKKGGKEEAA